MSTFARKAVMAALASIALAGVTVAAPANAATRAIYVETCNKTSKGMDLWLEGKDANGKWSATASGSLWSGDCGTTGHWRFATNQWVQIHHKFHGTSQWRVSGCKIPPDARNGHRCTFH